MAFYDEDDNTSDQPPKILGTIITSTYGEPESSLSYWQVTKKAGFVQSINKMVYDAVLEQPLQPNECLIDFLAVDMSARGQGIGTALLKWAEQNAQQLISERSPIRKDCLGGISMTLWVAEDNLSAQKLYEKNGYKIIQRTDHTQSSVCACFFSCSCLLNRFLGHPVWYKMQKTFIVSYHNKTTPTMHVATCRSVESPQKQTIIT